MWLHIKITWSLLVQCFLGFLNILQYLSSKSFKEKHLPWIVYFFVTIRGIINIIQTVNFEQANFRNGRNQSISRGLNTISLFIFLLEQWIGPWLHLRITDKMFLKYGTQTPSQTNQARVSEAKGYWAESLQNLRIF